MVQILTRPYIYIHMCGLTHSEWYIFFNYGSNSKAHWYLHIFINRILVTIQTYTNKSLPCLYGGQSISSEQSRICVTLVHVRNSNKYWVIWLISNSISSPVNCIQCCINCSYVNIKANYKSDSNFRIKTLNMLYVQLCIIAGFFISNTRT